ncbi:MAG: DUF1998 domain-containing protein, partial [Acidobacteriota bacterium]
IGGISYHRHPQVGSGAVFVYDGHPGGVGIAARGFRDLPELLGRVLALLDGCDCESGCPSCVQSPKCGNGNRPLDKAGAARVVRMLLDREAPVEVDEEAEVEELEGPLTRRVFLPREAGEAGMAAEPKPSPHVRRERSGELSRRQTATGEGLTGALPQSQRSSTGRADAPAEVGRAGAPPAPPRPAPAGRSGRPGGEGSGESGGDLEVSGGDPDTLPLTILFDLETLRSADEVGGWGNAHRMGISVGVACLLEEGRFEVFREERVGELADLLTRATLVVGFNVKRFDYRVLSGYTGVEYGRLVRTLDLMEDVQRRIGFRVGLDHLARETLGAEKSADGLQCLEWVRQGRMDLVESYCRRDVELTRDLYLHGRREGCVWLRHRRRGRVRVPVEW